MPAAVNQFSVMLPARLRDRSRPPGAPRPHRRREPATWPRLALVAALCSSCSVIGVKRLEPDLPRGEQPDCTSTWTLPLIDMGVAVISGSAAVLLHAAAASEDNEGGDSGGFRAAGWTSVGVAALFIGSATYGAVQRNRCRNAEIDAERLAPSPTFLDESRPLKGGQGAACQDDKDCDEDLLCGLPMKTCIPANPPEESPPP